MSVAATSVVVVSHRPGPWLAPCLASVADRAEQLIVVDNGSDGAAAARIGRDVGAEVVTLRTNRGFTGGVAAGLARARGDLIGLLNDDAVAPPEWLSAAADRLSAPGIAAYTPKVALSGRWAEIVLPDDEWYAPGDARPLGRQLRSVTVDGEEVLDAVEGVGVHDVERPPGESSFRWTAGRRPFYVPLPEEGTPVLVDGEAVTPRAVVPLVNNAGTYLLGHGIGGDRGVGAPDDGRFDTNFEPFGWSGTAPVLRRDALADVGGLASHFFAYNEDTDWCLRARLHGWGIAFDPSVTVEHRRSATSGGTTSAFVRHLAQRNSLLCLVRTAPPERAIEHVWRALSDGGPRRRAFLRHLPWALATRAEEARRWQVSPREVWDRWVGVGTSWDQSPARIGP